jgi:hypothetical protein
LAQVDIRRSISATYYALFHAASIEAADSLVGDRDRETERYGLVYRSIDHGALRRLCEEVQKPNLTEKYRRFQPEGGFAASIKGFAATVVELQRKRHDADYDPLVRFSRTEARFLITGARTALTRFRGVGNDQRLIFVTLLLFTPR